MTKTELISYVNAIIKDNENKEINAFAMRDVLDKIIQFIDDSEDNADYEPAFFKNNGFNRVFGTGETDVARGNHKHTFSDITDLQSTLDGKAPITHDHSIAQVEGLQDIIDDLTTGGSTEYVSKINNVNESINGLKTFTDNVTAPAFFESSDERLKENIIHISETFRTFELKSQEGKRYGVIAQEIESTNPELVKKDDKGMLSVNYIDLLCMKMAEMENKIFKLESIINSNAN